MINVDDIPITIEGVEYKGRDLDVSGQEILRHLVDVREKTYELHFQLAQLDVLDKAFTEALRTVAPKKEQGDG